MTSKFIFHYIIIMLCFSASAYAGEVVLMDIDAGIGPGTSSFISDGIEYAESRQAEALVISLDTPGGLLDATRDIVSRILESPVPVIVYVSPSGSRAGSAGVFITLAGHIAAMAPGTNIGAAHPVGIDGGSDTTAMFEKVTNDAAAFIRTIAQKRNRNQSWAELSVRESISSTEKEALDSGVVDIVAPGIDSLLKAIHGWTVELPTGIHSLETAGAEIVIYEMDWKQRLLSFLSDPNIAYALLMLGILGITMELYHPGAIFPGVVGAISIVLAGYSLQMLPVNYTGLLLILISIILFILEVKVNSFGLLTVGGGICFVLGSVMLIDSPLEFMQVSLSVIISATVFTVLFFLIVIGFGLRAQKRNQASGQRALSSEIGIAMTDIRPGHPGTVKVHGEIWSAVSESDIASGTSVKILEINFLKLTVGPAKVNTK